RRGPKLGGGALRGLTLAFGIFYLTVSVAMPWLLYSEQFAAFWSQRNKAVVQAYQDYVTEQRLTVQQALNDREGRLDAMDSGVYVVMVGTPLSSVEVPADEDSLPRVSDDISYGVTWAAGGDYSSERASSSVGFVMEMHQIRCADGTLYVSTSPAVLGYEGLGRAAGLLLALAGFCAVTVPYIVRLLRRLGELSREAGVLMAGDLDHVIHVKGRDEISGLGEDIERLRRSVLARIEGEREAVGANSRLITSLSHDIRTPLTKLTGYLDILLYRKYETSEEHDAFLRLASEKAAQLKALTDQLFAGAQVGASRP
ncbi:MAG: HAMP domain-containing protein, partial [Oscillospiraceae bacterium]|nr:HAMP domain-containing protein [Oscillospiraceae bacterium]